MSKELLFKSGIELKSLIKKKEISPVELTKLSLERIEETEPKVNAFFNVMYDQAILKAKEIESKISKGQELGLLGGLPTSIKDLEPVKDVQLTKGSLTTGKMIADNDQIIVERIKKEDGIILGKTSCPEFGHSGSNETKIKDHCRNPWNLEFTSGGSSGGAAASVAVGVNTVAQGSDGGGSVRIPASFCGLFGMIGTQGRIPRRHAGLMSWLPVNYSRIGPISWYVEDSALLFEVMAGPHPENESMTIQDQEDFLKDLDKGIKGKKIAIPHNFGTRVVDKEVFEVFDKNVKLFEKLGANLEEIKFDFDLNDYEQPFHKHLMHTFSFCVNEQFYNVDPKKLMPHVKNTIERGKKVMASDYAKALAQLSEYRFKMERIFSKFDFIISPTVAIPPHKCNERPNIINGKIDISRIDDKEMFEENNYDYSSWIFVLAQFTAPFNWSGNPAVSLPCGFTKSGLPIGLQLAGRKRGELSLIQASKAFEEIKPWHQNRPSL